MFVFVIVLFYAFFNSQSKDIEANRIQSAQGRISSDLELVNYLKTPHTLDGSAMTISSFYRGPQMVLAAACARSPDPVVHEEKVFLNVVAEMAQAAGGPEITP